MAHNLLHDSVYQLFLQRCAAREYAAIVASPPCFTFSVSRHFRSTASPDGGPPVVRSREYPLGRPDVPAAHRSELAEANGLMRRTAALLAVAQDAGAEYILKHPADRGLPCSPLFWTPRTPLSGRCLPSSACRRRHATSCISFPQCALGADTQSYTTMLVNLGLALELAHLEILRFTQSTH
eukprot:5468388-Pleurochrysis_carterae.AAC.7